MMFFNFYGTLDCEVNFLYSRFVRLGGDIKNV
jgi:hypothetical protein